jgi:CheY-like chemotaxis protein
VSIKVTRKIRHAIDWRSILKVGLIDDDEIVLALTVRILEDMGHDVTTRSSAMGASNWLLNERPDLVLVDLSMPALPGDEWLGMVMEDSLVTSDGYEPAFAIFSGRDVEELEKVVRETCALGYIRKQGGPEGFERAFEKIVEAMDT